MSENPVPPPENQTPPQLDVHEVLADAAKTLVRKRHRLKLLRMQRAELQATVLTVQAKIDDLKAEIELDITAYRTAIAAANAEINTPTP